MLAKQAHLPTYSPPELSIEFVISVITWSQNFSSCQGILEGFFSLIFVHADLYSELQIYILNFLFYLHTAPIFILRERVSSFSPAGLELM